MLTNQKKIFRNILVVRLSSLGDVILTTPLIRILKNQYPEAKIDFLAAKPFDEIYINNPNVNRILAYDKLKTLKEITYWKNSLLNNEIKHYYDLVIDLQNNFRSKHFIKGIADKVISYDKKRIDKIKMVWFKSFPENTTPIPERYINSCSEIGLEPDGKGCELFTANDKLTQDEVLIAPGAKHFTKRWLPSNFAILADMLAGAGYKVGLIGGKADKEICSEIINAAKHDINDYSGAVSIKETLEYINKAILVISNDSAAMHIAAARNKPVIAIFGFILNLDFLKLFISLT